MRKQLLIYVIHYSSLNLSLYRHLFFFSRIYNVYILDSLSLENCTTRLTASELFNNYAAVEFTTIFGARSQYGGRFHLQGTGGPIPFPPRRSGTTPIAACPSRF